MSKKKQFALGVQKLCVGYRIQSLMRQLTRLIGAAAVGVSSSLRPEYGGYTVHLKNGRGKEPTCLMI
ncbi:hypothetical protein J3U75_06735 [Snodgrassella sp. B3088]|uniref:hypothetical protein n=1 Tax=Snodgrassella sp. B3088 TaxID=2818038 RepID=UPI00226A3798|nr:hypothetical protein [Snodgrassella sp. B3088]MCX8749078.1 hypothetical protein [Snodgrassella sp. B3088]